MFRLEKYGVVYLDQHYIIVMRKIFLMLYSLLLFLIPSSFAQEFEPGVDYLAPKLIMPKDIYIISQFPVPIHFDVKAIDDIDGDVPVQCDKISGSIFNVGKTIVRCVTEDTAGNERKASFVVTVGYEIVDIPTWVKQTTKFWVEGSVDDKTYGSTIKFLIEEKIVKVPVAKTSSHSEIEIPLWIKTNAKFWVEGGISDDEYSIMLQWLINRNIIKID